MFTAMANVALSGARQRVRLNKMLGDARELAAKTRRLRDRASAHANRSIPHRLTLAKGGRAVSGPNASISQTAGMTGCLGAERSGRSASHDQSGAQRCANRRLERVARKPSG
jgi:hypothetical protein